MAILAKLLYLLELIEAIRDGVLLCLCPMGIVTISGILAYLLIQLLDYPIISAAILFSCILLILLEEGFISSNR